MGMVKPLYPAGTWVIPRFNKEGKEHTLIKEPLIQVTKVDDYYMYTDDGRRWCNRNGRSPDTVFYSAILCFERDEG